MGNRRIPTHAHLISPPFSQLEREQPARGPPMPALLPLPTTVCLSWSPTGLQTLPYHQPFWPSGHAMLSVTRSTPDLSTTYHRIYPFCQQNRPIPFAVRSNTSTIIFGIYCPLI